MENFIVSARKYRPTTFDLVVGQQSITTTLKNAIKNKHLAQAYLFCGPRGVGKTTCARIFAKTINCFNITQKVEPCNQCESCKSFNDSRSFNIHELDAASNNSVDDIRTLIEQVRIPPQVGKYSIYIIDEVHMLSASAFNAFLKTLEEPPKHAVFILATTEKHKIIPTILSRCQIFDFNRIQIDDAVKYLEEISKNEGNEYEPDGLNIIAQKADGSLRDALSIFDQIISFSGGKVTYKNVIENLNVLDYEYYFRLVDDFLNADIAGSFLIFNEILNEGFDSHNFITGLSKHFRDLLVCNDASTLQLLEVGNNIKERYKQQSAKCSQEFVFECLNICNQCDINFRNARNQRLHVELALVQLCQVMDKKKSNLETSAVGSTMKEPAPKTYSIPASTSPKGNQTPIQREAPSRKKEPENKGIYVPSIPSIRNLISPQSGNKTDEPESAEKDESVEEPVILREEHFSEEKLQSVFLRFVESIKVDKPRLYSTLKSQTPLLTGGFNIELTLSNQAQLDDFNKNIRQDLMSSLRDELQNDNIVLNIKITEQKDQNVPYTDEEKFRHMLAKNPALGKLKQQMNLDFE
jgi:DNA polymerase III subunit gamma/tau